jgi:hypothetical protein
MQISLSIITLLVKSGEPFDSSQSVQSVVNPGQWETVLPCDIVKFPVVYAEAQVPILLPDENDGGCPAALTLR